MGHVRAYTPADYEAVIALYQHDNGRLFGGQFDPARDSRDKLENAITQDPQSLLVYEAGKDILGTVSLIENGRVAWLFRFAVAEGDNSGLIARELYGKARDILVARGHGQILVYSDAKNDALALRYKSLGMTGGGLYTCFWEELA